MNHPKTCIIILSHNVLSITQKCLNCLYDHTEDFILVMIDNGSTDGTPQYLKEFANKHSNMILILNESNLGVIGGRNQGYEAYKNLKDKPEYFIFLDNDQFVQEGWLEQYHDVMDTGGFDIIGQDARLMNRSFAPIHQCKHPYEVFTYVSCCGMMIKSKVAETIGMFDPNYNPCYFEDPDYCFRAKQAGFSIGWNYKAKIIHEEHQTLGKNPRKLELFKKSHAYFKSKWQKTTIPHIIQHHVPALEDSKG